MITTFTRRTVNPLDLNPEDICIEDIAHSLSMINRFNGHSVIPISVAQHSCYVSQLSAPGWKLQGLLHDATEAYLGDVTKWLKRTPAFAAYRDYEYRAHVRIMDVFNLSYQLHESVQWADEVMVRYEGRKAFGEDYNFGGHPQNYPPVTQEEKQMIGEWSPWKWQDAKSNFLDLFWTLISPEWGHNK